MTIQIGEQADHGFEAPMGLLSDCHRRIEKFLGAQLEVTRQAQGGALDERQREALEKALRYFAEAAPWHTADEEYSLFPRMRASDDPEVRKAFERMKQLEHEHRHAEAKHAEVERLVRHWLEDGQLDGASLEQLQKELAELQQIYQQHIAFEDEVLFPLAERLMSEQQLQAIGREMAERRGVAAPDAGPRCKHARPGQQDAAETE